MPPPISTPDASPDDRYLARPGARLRYRDEGRGPPVLLLHGWTLDLDMWDPQVCALADRYRLIRLDRRGHGLSTGQPGLADDVADAIALCRHLDTPQVAVVGMSQGARVAQALAAAAPELIACVVLDGAPGPAATPPSSGAAPGTAAVAADLPFEHYRELARTAGLDAFRREWSRHPLTQLHGGNDQGRRLLARMLARYPGTDLMQPSVTSPPPGDPAPTPGPAPLALRQPVLVINGALDLTSRRHAGDALAQGLTNARRELIADAGHIPNLDRPQAYNALLGAFLTEHLPRSG